MEKHTAESLGRIPDGELDRILAILLFNVSELNTMMGRGWNWGYSRWNLWGDSHPEEWSCVPDHRIREYPQFSSTYEGMARIIGKMQEKGFAVTITRESEVTFANVDGQEIKYVGPAHEGKNPPRFLAIAAILAMEATDTRSLARWSLRGGLKG